MDALVGRQIVEDEQTVLRLQVLRLTQRFQGRGVEVQAIVFQGPVTGSRVCQGCGVEVQAIVLQGPVAVQGYTCEGAEGWHESYVVALAICYTVAEPAFLTTACVLNHCSCGKSVCV